VVTPRLSVTDSSARDSVILDVQATQSASHRDRGIARYVAELACAIQRRHPEIVHSFLLNPELAPPGRIEPLVASGRVAYSDRCDLRGARAFHIMSPFELDVPLDQLWLQRSSARWLPLVVTLYDVIPEVYPDRYLADMGLRRRYRSRAELVRAADLVLAISDATAADAVDRLRIDPARVVVTGGAAAPHFMPPSSRTVALAMARAAVPELGERFVVYTAGLDDRKNFERLFEAWSLLSGPIRDGWQLVMVCQMDELGRNHLRHLADAVGIGKNLLLPGFVADDTLRFLYQSTDLSVFPSLYEGFGLPVAEALACGAPTIGSNTSAIRELLVPEAQFDPTDAAAMSTAIARALTDAGVRAVLDRQAARPQRTWDDVADRTVAAYEGLLARPRRGRRSKPLVAVVTPLPPAASGIAVYTFRLIDALQSHCDVHVYPDGERWVQDDGTTVRVPDGVEVLPLACLSAQDTAHGGYDCVLYCIGNSQYHSGALAQLRRRRGVVLAHEARMTELYALAIDEPDAVPGGFAAALRAMYGDALPAEAARVGRLSADAAERLGLLMAQELVALAERFVVMSEFAAELVRIDAPQYADKVATVPFGMPAPGRDATPAADREPLVVTVGVVNEVKQTSLLLEALPHLLERHPDVRMAVVGRCSDDDRDQLVALASLLGVSDKVTVTGEVDEASYRAWLDRAAVAVQLRRTSNGECSAAVADCFAAGAPVVLTDIGANRELPSAVAARVSPYITAPELADVLADLLADPSRRRAMAAAGAEHARASSFAHAAERLFADVIVG
jgi:glycosyltransferase involved in cell wall biosynthesis